MSHVKTYPEVFVDNESYIPFNWDFTDFNEKLDYVADKSISHYGCYTCHNIFLYYIFPLAVFKLPSVVYQIP